MSDGQIIINQAGPDLPAILQKRLADACSNHEVLTQAHKILAEESRPYVPEETGKLINSAQITHRSVRWRTEYAHYQYMGVVYGPNFRVWNAASNTWVWRSPRGKKKYPTNRRLHYTKSGAGDHWVDRMLHHRREILKARIASVIQREIEK